MTRDSRKTDYANGFDQCVSSQPTLKIFLERIQSASKSIIFDNATLMENHL
ncbi:MAG: hypothetical protein ACI9NC_003294 [Verrucomicrobiales bacterium]|jgi:hypothetical protein